MDGNEIENKLQEKIKIEKKKLSNIENKLNEEAALELNDTFDNEPEGTGVSESTPKHWKDAVKKAEFELGGKTKEELIETLKEESEVNYCDKIKVIDLKKEKRKLSSYTLSLNTIESIGKLSKNNRMNKSRFIEMLVENYEESQKEKSMTLFNSAGPININLNELSEKVAEILQNKNL